MDYKAQKDSMLGGVLRMEPAIVWPEETSVSPENGSVHFLHSVTTPLFVHPDDFRYC